MHLDLAEIHYDFLIWLLKSLHTALHPRSESALWDEMVHSFPSLYQSSVIILIINCFILLLWVPLRDNNVHPFGPHLHSDWPPMRANSADGGLGIWQIYLKSISGHWSPLKSRYLENASGVGQSRALQESGVDVNNQEKMNLRFGRFCSNGRVWREAGWFLVTEGQWVRSSQVPLPNHQKSVQK